MPGAVRPRVRPAGAALALAFAAVAHGAAARAAPSPTPGPPGPALPSPTVTVLRTPEPGPTPPPVRAAAAALADLDTGQVLYEKGGRERRPVASLTKIATALLVLERADPSEVVTVSREAAAPDALLGVAELGLLPGERIRVRELLYALLLQSANDAALALAEHVAGSVDGFVRRMNARARELGARHTRFASPTGLDDAGYSTALDLVRLTRAAYRLPLFAEIVATRFHEVPAPDGPPRLLQNRNALLWLYPGAVGVKTGYTRRAGFCVVAVAEREGRRLVAVVLGAPGEAFSDAAALLSYGFAGFEPRTLVQEGRSLGWVDLVGGRVAVAAGGTLAALVPVAPGSPEPVVVTRVDPGAAFPPLPGEAVGRVVARVGDLRVGTVPLVVAEVPPPPPPAAGSWWQRAAEAVLAALASLLGALLG